jgi:hypothetical protein
LEASPGANSLEEIYHNSPEEIYHKKGLAEWLKL